MKDSPTPTLPQTIAHRGYRAQYPENTLQAMRKAVEAGAHALETDIHLSRDGVVVLSHDATLKRCFGQPDKIRDRDWAYLSTLRTAGPNPQPMARLRDLLAYLSEPGLERVWVLLDVKTDDAGSALLAGVAAAVAGAPQGGPKPWAARVVLGVWHARYLPLCAALLPGFAVAFIGVSTGYARRFLAVPNVAFNMLVDVLVGPMGAGFLRAAKAKGRPVFAWTVNDKKKMRWCVRKGLDGVVTDDPKMFMEVREEFETGKVGSETWTWKEYMLIARINLLVLVFSWVFMWKFGVSWGIDKRFKRR